MLLLVSWAELFLDTLGKVGSFLMTSPFASIKEFEVLLYLFPDLANLTIGHLIIGSGLVTILLFKCLKFLLDLF